MLKRIDGVDGIATLEVLTPASCSDVADRVLQQRDSWRPRSASGTFFTLGVNSYMDLAMSGDPSSTYDDPAAADNEVLRSHFPDVYERLAEALTGALGMTVRYADDLALPGFHVWQRAGIPREPVASVHFDLQYLQVVKRPAYTRASGTVSFTLPVRLPAAGSSLRVWPHERYRAWSGRPVSELPEPEVLPYTEGVALVHSGHLLHQIGVTPTVTADDMRITLQGHGLVVDDDLVCYW